MKKNILITGGAGFIGYHLCEYLLNRGDFRIDIIDNLTRGKFDRDFSRLINHPKIKFFKKDLTQPDSLRFLNKKYDYIYHLSGIVGVKNVVHEPVQVLRVNILSILNLLRWIRQSQRSVKGILLASTSEVYAGTLKHYRIDIPTNEEVNLCLEDITNQRSTYALSKMVGESACLNYFNLYRLPVVIARFHNIYGPRMGYSHVIPELICKAARSRILLEVYSPDHTRAFCYISDAVKAIALLIKSKKAPGQIFNIGNSQEEIAIKKLAEKIINLIKPGLKVKRLGSNAGSTIRRCPDITKLKEIIAFNPQVSLSEGLQLTWQWYKKHLE